MSINTCKKDALGFCVNLQMPLAISMYQHDTSGNGGITTDKNFPFVFSPVQCGGWYKSGSSFFLLFSKSREMLHKQMQLIIRGTKVLNSML